MEDNSDSDQHGVLPGQPTADQENSNSPHPVPFDLTTYFQTEQHLIDQNSPQYEQLLIYWGRRADEIVGGRLPLSAQMTSLPPIKTIIPTKIFDQISTVTHINRLYCPDVFDENKCPKRHTFHISSPAALLFGSFLRNKILAMFPGVHLNTEDEWIAFESTSTFFQAVTAPSDIDDTYGEPYASRENIYVIVKPGIPDDLVFFSSEELISSFLTHQCFVNPKSTQNEKFTDLQINRLIALLNHIRRDRLLHELICLLKMRHSDVMQNMTVLSTIFGFKECLIDLLEIGMLLRGWDEKDSYPLKASDTSNKVNEGRVIERLMSLMDKIEKEWKPFKNLHLVRYDKGEISFEENYTLLINRLTIVLDNENVYACIRLSSNIFVATAWYYLNHFYKEPPFELSSLSYIS